MYILIKHLRSVVVCAFLSLVLIGCFSHKENLELDISESSPINEFFIGSWEAEKFIGLEENEDNYKLEVIVLDEKNLKIVLLSANGEFLDGTTAEYYFMDANIIFVDNLRVTGGEQWRLERDDQKLIVYRTIAEETDIIIFQRVSD